MRAPALVREEAERAAEFERIVERCARHVGLAENRQRRAVCDFEQAFHGGQSGGLISRDMFALHVAGGEQLQNGGDDADDHADADEGAAVSFVAVREQIKRADAPPSRSSRSARRRACYGRTARAPSD